MTPWLTYLLETAARSLLVGGAMAAALVACQVTRPRTKLWAWTIVLVAALAMPALGWITPSLRVPVPAVWLAGARPLVSSRVGVMTTTAEAATASRMAMAGASAVPPPVAAALGRAGWPAAIVSLYVLGALWLLGSICLGWGAARRLDRSARLLDHPDLRARAQLHTRALGITRLPRLAESPQLVVPVTTGVWRPAILLPDSWREWRPTQLDAVLIHELSHIGRRDALVQRLSLLHRVVFWFSPLSWWLNRALTQLAEHTSDETVLASGIDQTDYAETLLGFFARMRQEPRRADWQVAMARGADADAERRVDRILDWKGGPSVTLTRSLLIAMVLATAPVAMIAAAVRPTQAAKPEPLALPASPALLPASPVLTAPPAAPALPTPPVSPSPQIPPNRPAVEPDVTAQLWALGHVSAIEAPQLPQTASTPQTPAAPVIYTHGPGIVDPVLLYDKKPTYTPEAVQAGIEGAVELEVVINADGTVGEERVTVSLDQKAGPFGLDEQAMIAAKGWRFQPATRNGIAVPIRVSIEMRFTKPRPVPPGQFGEGAYQPNAGASMWGMVNPVPVQYAKTPYTPDAIRAKLQGMVRLEIVILEDGTVGDVRIAQSLDQNYGLDEQAVIAAKKWRFTPGTLNGAPVRFVTTIEMSFTLR
jgi:TonB family protein